MGKAFGAFARGVRDAIRKTSVRIERTGATSLTLQIIGNWNYGPVSGETEPVKDARVLVDKQPAGLSDQNGVVRLDGLKPGCHHLEVHANGFKPSLLRAEVKPDSGDTIRINLGLSDLVNR